jgi:hypothetical protein
MCVCGVCILHGQKMGHKTQIQRFCVCVRVWAQQFGICALFRGHKLKNAVTKLKHN